MNTTIIKFSLAIMAIGMLASCTNDSNNTKDDTTKTETVDTASKPISIVPASTSPEFPDATLLVKNMKSEMSGSDSVKITIDYTVSNYELKSQTSDASTKACNNSKDGQHIHFILDNAPYAALYEPTHTFTVAKNSKHYVMSFLSRSYHESIKSPKAAVLYYFSVDDKGKITKLDNPKTPMVFYSRPKGEYIGDDTKNLLLDFYVYNAQLATDGNKIKAVINGTEFVIDKWQPYFIQNAPMGALTVNLKLIDKQGAELAGDNTSVSRSVKLASAEPTK